jgi:GNAT superfamily N-acetyltransferase
MICCQVETWADIWRDGQEIFKIHYDELALNKEHMPLGLDNDAYTKMELGGYLLVIAARRDGVLIGYVLASVIAHHPHNKNAGKVAAVDMFYIRPDQRHGGAGAKLLTFTKTEMKRIGVVDASISTKVHFENAQFMDLVWGKPTDVVRRIIL